MKNDEIGFSFRVQAYITEVVGSNQSKQLEFTYLFIRCK